MEYINLLKTMDDEYHQREYKLQVLVIKEELTKNSAKKAAMKKLEYMRNTIKELRKKIGE